MPLLRISVKGHFVPGPAGPLFGENDPLDHFPGPHSPPLHSPRQGQTAAKPCRLRSAAPIRRVNRRTDTGFAPVCPHHVSLTFWFSRLWVSPSLTALRNNNECDRLPLFIMKIILYKPPGFRYNDRVSAMKETGKPVGVFKRAGGGASPADIRFSGSLRSHHA